MFTPTMMYYCDELGAYTALNANVWEQRALRPMLQKAWLLLDVDTATWLPDPGTWFHVPRIFAFASSPNRTRQNHIVKHFAAAPWIMKPWSDDEILAEWYETRCRPLTECSPHYQHPSIMFNC